MHVREQIVCGGQDKPVARCDVYVGEIVVVLDRSLFLAWVPSFGLPLADAIDDSVGQCMHFCRHPIRLFEDGDFAGQVKKAFDIGTRPGVHRLIIIPG